MNLQLLIDSIVRQTTVLIAQLATAGGARAPLAHIANQVFLDLAQELNSQGVSRRVSADMFGLALRTYLRKIQRLNESSTERGRSLWEAVLSYLGEGPLRTRAQVMRHFSSDDPDMLRGVLHDLGESGLVFRIGSGQGAAYRAATSEELGALTEQEAERADELVWAIVFREGPLDRSELERRLQEVSLQPLLSRLEKDGRVVRDPNSPQSDPRYTANHFFVPLGSASGWEAAVFDHFQAMVRTITIKLGRDPESKAQDTVGGSTYSFDIWPGHPFEREVLEQLGELRARTSELRTRVLAYNKNEPRPPNYSNVTLYAGQCVTDEHIEDGEKHV